MPSAKILSEKQAYVADLKAKFESAVSGCVVAYGGINVENDTKLRNRLDKQNIIHVPVGKASFGAEKLYTNLDTVMEAIAKAKPAAAKGTYFKSATIATTMGPGIRLNTLKYGV